jgi:hypothetical protein
MAQLKVRTNRRRRYLVRDRPQAASRGVSGTGIVLNRIVYRVFLLMLTSDPNGEILGSDASPKEHRRPNCRLQGTLDLLISEGPGSGAMSRPGRGAVHTTRFGRGLLCRPWLARSGPAATRRQEVDQRKMGCKRERLQSSFYSLTPKGREQLVEKRSEWEKLTRAMGPILGGGAEPRREEA